MARIDNARRLCLVLYIDADVYSPRRGYTEDKFYFGTQVKQLLESHVTLDDGPELTGIWLT
jgi:hypothetical protein